MPDMESCELYLFMALFLCVFLHVYMDFSGNLLYNIAIAPQDFQIFLNISVQYPEEDSALEKTMMKGVLL